MISKKNSRITTIIIIICFLRMRKVGVQIGLYKLWNINICFLFFSTQRVLNIQNACPEKSLNQYKHIFFFK